MHKKKQPLFLIFFLLIFVAFNSACTSHKSAPNSRNSKNQLTDTEKAFLIHEKITEDENLNLYNVYVHVYNNKAYLVGICDGKINAIRAKELAYSVNGIFFVKTHFVEKDKTNTYRAIDDFGITTDIKTALGNNKDIWSNNVSVKTLQCNVVLLGIMATEQDIEIVVNTARNTKKVEHVENFLSLVE